MWRNAGVGTKHLMYCWSNKLEKHTWRHSGPFFKHSVLLVSKLIDKRFEKKQTMTTILISDICGVLVLVLKNVSPTSWCCDVRRAAANSETDQTYVQCVNLWLCLSLRAKSFHCVQSDAVLFCFLVNVSWCFGLIPMNSVRWFSFINSAARFSEA